MIAFAKAISIIFLLTQSINADSGQELYEEDCAFSCHQPDPRLGHVALVISDRFDLRSQIKTCSNNFAPFWSEEERVSVTDYLYKTYYVAQYDHETNILNIK